MPRTPTERDQILADNAITKHRLRRPKEKDEEERQKIASQKTWMISAEALGAFYTHTQFVVLSAPAAALMATGIVVGSAVIAMGISSLRVPPPPKEDDGFKLSIRF